MRGADPRLLPGADGLTAARLLAVLLLGCAMGLVLGSRPLAGWAGRLPPGWDAVQDAATRWDAAMERGGLTVPYDTLHQRVRDWSTP